MANVIRIKRRDSGGAAGAPVSLENAELAYNEADNTLYYGFGTGGAGGSATTVVAIGGPGSFVTRGTSQEITGAKNFSGDVDFTGTIDFNNLNLLNIADPTLDHHAVNKRYVDAAVQGLDIKDSVVAASTGNVNVSSAPAAIDDVTLAEDDRILLKDQNTASQNGIYVFNGTGEALTRATDANTDDKVSSGMFVFVTGGDTHENQGFVLQTPDPIDLGTTSLTFTQFSGAGSLEAGDGMYRTGNTLHVGTASSTRIVVSANDIDLAETGVSASTYKSVTVDLYGRVTAGSNPTTLSGYGITDAVEEAGVAGFIARDGSGNVNSRTITGTANRVTVSNGTGGAGNPTIDIHASYAGQNTINTVGTIATGTWQGTVIGLLYGGTGRDLSSDSDGAFYKKSGAQLVVATIDVDYLNNASVINGGTF